MLGCFCCRTIVLLQCYCNAILCANGRKAKLRMAFTQDDCRRLVGLPETRSNIIDIINVVSFDLISVLCFFHICVLLATESGIKSSARADKKSVPWSFHNGTMPQCHQRLLLLAPASEPDQLRRGPKRKRNDSF